MFGRGAATLMMHFNFECHHQYMSAYDTAYTHCRKRRPTFLLENVDDICSLVDHEKLLLLPIHSHTLSNLAEKLVHLWTEDMKVCHLTLLSRGTSCIHPLSRCFFEETNLASIQLCMLTHKSRNSFKGDRSYCCNCSERNHSKEVLSILTIDGTRLCTITFMKATVWHVSTLRDAHESYTAA